MKSALATAPTMIWSHIFPHFGCHNVLSIDRLIPSPRNPPWEAPTTSGPVGRLSVAFQSYDLEQADQERVSELVSSSFLGPPWIVTWFRDKKSPALKWRMKWGFPYGTSLPKPFFERDVYQ